jgi:hypothetical protein
MNMLDDDERRARRVRMVRAHGANDATAEEVLAYTEAAYGPSQPTALAALAEDELHVEAWDGYVQESRARGVAETLKAKFPQLRFPLVAGISQTEMYRRATRRGDLDAAAADAPGVAFESPETLHLELVNTIAGRIPVITAANRHDFEALVCAFTERNEPVLIPASMGACLVSGLNNWDRVGQYRKRWQSQHPNPDEVEWREEFRRLSRNKPLYQDRLMILSAGAYSAVDASEAGATADEWSSRSLVIRREHEAMHYFTARLFGRIRSHALDELLADFTGLLRASGRYESTLALTFLGLQAFPIVRPTGRFVNYTSGVLSDAAMSIVASLVVAGAARLERLVADWRIDPCDLPQLANVIATLASCTLEELASPEAFELSVTNT